MAHVERLTVYPVKALDGMDCESVSIRPGGTLAHDREFAMFDDAGDVVNGKRTSRVHDIDTGYDPESETLSVTTDDDSASFDLRDERGRSRAADWLGVFFGVDLTVERDETLGYVDRREMGPSVISTATLETVASWFDDVTVDGLRRRLRANVEIGGVPAFWEDRFVGADAPAFRAGGVRFEGVTPCGRCVVPQRDPDTGEATPGFREQFVKRRQATFPEWADQDAFDHFYTVMLITHVPEADRGAELAVGDPVEVVPAAET
ncbi:MOSC domain-containing protein [Haloarcula sp. Atlit-7R]|uniref:MOSC domain-containing protein n=1 Tax=Haloarcula sp. Atlit-7R TaxID=2282125 RepID=UPI000EF1678D|nr:MOSC N-terminal beta barrel domain-containing protein [Haloarcula sp. Atlit-7R]RLN02009.1 MOSC domain-containing protein [Haloarcula sp. Atlit-7R]